LFGLRRKLSGVVRTGQTQNQTGRDEPLPCEDPVKQTDPSDTDQMEERETRHPFQSLMAVRGS